MRVICLVCVFAVAMVFNTAAFGDSIMCSKGVVSSGDSEAQVLDKCGKPVHKVKEDIAYGKLIEMWTYKIGGCYRQFHFESGVLQSIKDTSLN